jgi:hypothetical protein
MADELQLAITPPSEVVVSVTQSSPPVVQLSTASAPQVVTTYAVGPQGPQGPPGLNLPPNALPVATGPVNLGGNRLTGLSTPQVSTDAVNSAYLDARFAVLIDELKPGPITQTKATVDTDFALVSGFNAVSVGPVTIQVGKALTIPTNSTWVIL